jgi:putative inorganic carbon (hco3(-)) transporter
LIFLIAMVSALSLLNYHDLLVLHGMEHLTREEVDARTGEVYQIRQLQGTGLFGDPNDLCLLLVTGMGLSLSMMAGRRAGMTRFLWLAPPALFGYVVTLTYSRGGFIAVLAGMLILMQGRFGVK